MVSRAVTCGGIKVPRLLILVRSLKREIAHLTHPRSVKKVKLNGQTVSEETVGSVISFMIAYVLVIMVSTFIVSADNLDFTTSFSAVLANIGNIGPGLGLVGATGNYSMLSDLSKVTLIFDMLAGRLEVYPMLVLFYLGTWRKS